MAITLSDRINELGMYLGGYFESVLKGEVSSLKSEQKREFNGSLISLFELVESQASKRPLDILIGSGVDDFERYDCGVELSLKKDFKKYMEGTSIVYEYTGNEGIGLRKIKTRAKTVRSLFNKVIIARLFDKRINDLFGALIVRDSPNALKIDFESIYLQGDREQLSQIWKDNPPIFGTDRGITEEWILRENFNTVFSEFRERYKANFEEQNILALGELAKFLQNENSAIEPRWKVIYTGPRHFRYQTFDLNMIKQDYMHTGRRILNYISKWDDLKGAKKYLNDETEKYKSNKKSSGYKEIYGEHFDSCIFYEIEGKQEILARKKDVVVNLRSEKDNPHFIEDSMEFITRIFSRLDLRKNEAELLSKGGLSSDKILPGVEGLFSLNFTLGPFEVPARWLENVIDIDDAQKKSLRERGLYYNPKKDPNFYCHDWVAHPKKNGYRAYHYRLEGLMEVQLQTSLMRVQALIEADHGKEYKDKQDAALDDFLRNSLVAKDSGFDERNIKNFIALLKSSHGMIAEEYKRRAHYLTTQLEHSRSNRLYFLNDLWHLYEAMKADFGDITTQRELGKIINGICYNVRD